MGEAEEPARGAPQPEHRPPGYPKRPIGFRMLNLVARYAPLKKKYFHTSLLMRRDLRDVGRPSDLPDDFEFKQAENEDLDAIMRHPEALPEEVYLSRLAAGDSCYCLKRRGEIAGYTWIRGDSCCVLCGFENGIDFLPLEEHRVYSYDLYVYEDNRRSGLGTVMNGQLLWALRSQGERELYSLVMPYNLASLKVHFSLGYETECLVHGYRLGNWAWTHMDRDGDRGRLDDWVARAKLHLGIH